MKEIKWNEISIELNTRKYNKREIAEETGVVKVSYAIYKSQDRYKVKRMKYWESNGHRKIQYTRLQQPIPFPYAARELFSQSHGKFPRLNRSAGKANYDKQRPSRASWSHLKIALKAWLMLWMDHPQTTPATVVAWQGKTIGTVTVRFVMQPSGIQKKKESRSCPSAPG